MNTPASIGIFRLVLIQEILFFFFDLRARRSFAQRFVSTLGDLYAAHVWITETEIFNLELTRLFSSGDRRGRNVAVRRNYV